MMRSGDRLVLANWLTGMETPQQVEHWKTVVCPTLFKDAARQHNMDVGPIEFTEKRPGEDRVPVVPDHISGPDVRLLIAEAPIRSAKPLVLRESGFVADLPFEDLLKLRRITRRAHAKRVPGDRLSDRNCDQIIEALGPDVAVKTLRDNHDGRNLN